MRLNPGKILANEIMDNSYNNLVNVSGLIVYNINRLNKQKAAAYMFSMARVAKNKGEPSPLYSLEYIEPDGIGSYDFDQ